MFTALLRSWPVPRGPLERTLAGLGRLPMVYNGSFCGPFVAARRVYGGPSGGFTGLVRFYGGSFYSSMGVRKGVPDGSFQRCFGFMRTTLLVLDEAISL